MDLAATEETESAPKVKRIDALVVKWRHTYLLLTCLLALTGYALVLLFPLLAIISGFNIIASLLSIEATDWPATLGWLAAMMFSGLLSYRSFQLKLSPPTGLTLNEEKAPEIFALVQRLHSHYKRPRIHRIVITASYELDIMKLPRSALPVWSTNVLVIGLPVLLCHSPKQFECMMARRIGQFSKKHNPVLNWLYQLRSTWHQYSTAYGKQNHLDSKILKWMYAAFASLYSAFSRFAARKDELNADTYVTEIYNDADVRNMITADIVYQRYLENSFWPAVEKIVSVKKKTSLAPYQKMAGTIHSNLKGNKLTALIDEAYNAVPESNSALPSLRSRLQNIGHDTPKMPAEFKVIAASHYLGSSLNSVTNLFDKLWLKNQASIQKYSREQS